MVLLPEWVRTVAEALPTPFTGKIELNCVDDGVAVVNVLVSFKPPRRDFPLDKRPKVVIAVL